MQPSRAQVALRHANSPPTVPLAVAMDDEQKQQIAARLKTLRGHTPALEIARTLDIGWRTYQGWELAEHAPSWRYAKRLAEHFGTTTEWIYYGDEAIEREAIQTGLELDARIKEYRKFSYEMRDAFKRVEDKLDLLAAALMNGEAIQPDPWTRMREAAERLAAAHATDGHPERRTAKTGTR